MRESETRDGIARLCCGVYVDTNPKNKRASSLLRRSQDARSASHCYFPKTAGNSSLLPLLVTAGSFRVLALNYNPRLLEPRDTTRDSHAWGCGAYLYLAEFRIAAAVSLNESCLFEHGQRGEVGRRERERERERRRRGIVEVLRECLIKLQQR